MGEEQLDGRAVWFDARLKCFVHKLNYNFDTKTGHLIMDRNSCPDMAGCIALFQQIDPRVEIIHAYQDRSGAPPELDMIYFNLRGGPDTAPDSWTPHGPFSRGPQT